MLIKNIYYKHILKVYIWTDSRIHHINISYMYVGKSRIYIFICNRLKGYINFFLKVLKHHNGKIYECICMYTAKETISVYIHSDDTVPSGEGINSECMYTQTSRLLSKHSYLHFLSNYFEAVRKKIKGRRTNYKPKVTLCHINFSVLVHFLTNYIFHLMFKLGPEQVCVWRKVLENNSF